MNLGSETERVEFKKSTSETKEGIISIASILNKHGAGTLYFGVKDNGDVVGQDIGKSTLRDLSQAISANISPSCWYEIARRDIGEGKGIIEVAFNGTNAPYSAFGRYYQRFADEDKKISDIELEKLFRARQKNYSAWESDTSGRDARAIDASLLKHILAATPGSGQGGGGESDMFPALKKLGLIAKDGTTLTNAGWVLLSSEKPILLKLAVFATSTKNSFIKLEHFEGNIFECINRAVEFVMQSITWTVSFDGAPQRKETPEIPLVAVREVVVNAFAHGSYESSTAFEVDVFSDRVSIYSPGPFPRGYTPEDFAFNSEEPVMLNPKIVDVLFRAGDIESFGSGFRRTFDACSKAGVEYRYMETKAGFRFEFMRGLGHEGVRELSVTEKTVLNQIAHNPYATAKQIAATIGKSEKTVYRATSALKERGVIQREGSDSNGYWIISSDSTN